MPRLVRRYAVRPQEHPRSEKRWRKSGVVPAGADPMSSVALACARRRLQPPALVAAQMRSQPWSSNAAPSHPVHVQIMKELIKSTGPWQLLRVYESYSAEYDSSLAMATINRIAMNGVKKAVLLSKPWPADGSDARIASDERFQALLTIPTLALQQNVSRTHAFPPP